MADYPATRRAEKCRRRKRQAVVCIARKGYNGTGKAAECRKSDNPRRTAMRRLPVARAIAAIAAIAVCRALPQFASAAPLDVSTRLGMEMINAAQDHLE